MKFFTTSLFAILTLSALSQDIKPLDYSAAYMKNHIRTRDCYELKYKGSLVIDSVHIGKEEFNEKGLLVRYTENYSRGKKMAEYHYSYDERGKLITSTVNLVFNDWKPMTFKLSFDQAGRVISRELPEAIPSFWVKETYTYNKSGILIKSEQWYLIDGVLKSMTTQEYPATTVPSDNSLTYIYDNRGLIIMHNKHVNGKVTSAKKYHYNKS